MQPLYGFVSILQSEQLNLAKTMQHSKHVSIGLYDIHYNDVIMSAVASQITSLTIVYSIVYSDADQRKHQSTRHWPLCGEFTGDRWIPHTNGQ